MAAQRECVVRVEPGGDHVLIDRATGAEYARGTEAQVRRAARGVYAITDAPRLGPVELDVNALGTGRHPEYVQYVAESVTFNGRPFTRGVDPWTDGVLYPDHLGIAFTERLADVPQFVRGVERHAARAVTSVRGTASVAAAGDPPLLGDWIRTGSFRPDRLARRFREELRGTWVIAATLKDPGMPQNGYWVTIDRVPGT